MCHYTAGCQYNTNIHQTGLLEYNNYYDLFHWQVHPIHQQVTRLYHHMPPVDSKSFSETYLGYAYYSMEKKNFIYRTWSSGWPAVNQQCLMT